MKEFTTKEMVYDMIKTLYQTGKLSAKQYVEYVDMLRRDDVRWYEIFDGLSRAFSCSPFSRVKPREIG